VRAEMPVEKLTSLNTVDLDALAELLRDAIGSNASVGFPSDLSHSDAVKFWTDVQSDVAAGRAVLLGVRDRGTLVGTVQMRFPFYPMGRNRAEVAKLLVHTAARRRGIAKVLMRQLEIEARASDRGLLFLDTETESPAERVYESLGWTKVGVIPNFAYRPDGELRSTSFYYKVLNQSA
jgi:acetyltransferase